jgi:hypothetical protein
MKKIVISNGETRLGYSFADLSETAKDKAIQEHRTFMMQTNDLDEEDAGGEEYWPEDDEVEDNIQANDYIFDITGSLIWIVTTVDKNHKPVKHRYHYTSKLSFDCELIDL